MCGCRWRRELAFSLAIHAHHPPTVSRFSIVAVGAEESSVKDGEIFNDLSELTRFEAKGEKERGKDPKTSERGVFSKILSAPRLHYVYYLVEAIWIMSLTGEKRNISNLKNRTQVLH